MLIYLNIYIYIYRYTYIYIYIFDSGCHFGAPLGFAGVPKSTSGTQKQHKVVPKGVQEGVLKKIGNSYEFLMPSWEA